MEFLNLRLDRLILLKTVESIERGEIVNLARNIAKHGLLVPITVRRILHTDRYEVISGIKRFYACRMAGIKIIPAYVIQAPPSLARLVIKRGEKQDMFDEAEDIRTALLSEGLEADELAEITGYNEKEVLMYLKLTKLGDFEREIVRRNCLRRECAAEVASFDDTCKRTELLGEVARLRLKLPEVKALCERERQGKKVYKRANRTPKFRDIRLFDNTVSRAVAMLKEAGVKADIASESAMGCTEYKIKIEN